MPRPIVLAVTSVLLLGAACSRDGERRDTAAAAAVPGPGANPADTGIRSTSNDTAAASHNMAGMNHDSMAHGAADTSKTRRAP